jgi:signal transduction histidine kinase
MSTARELRARDLFLSKLTTTLSASARKLARATRAAPELPAGVRDAALELRSLIRELSIITFPDEPVPLRPRKLELHAVLERYFEERKRIAARQGVRIAIERTGSIHCKLDEELFGTMLDELLSNATKYRRGRPVVMRAAFANGVATVSVINSGTWIGPKPTFQRFRRGESRSTVPGFGVGLWLTRRLAEAHGGSLSIAVHGKHTHATISLPGRAAEAAAFCATLR